MKNQKQVKGIQTDVQLAVDELDANTGLESAQYSKEKVYAHLKAIEGLFRELCPKHKEFISGCENIIRSLKKLKGYTNDDTEMINYIEYSYNQMCKKYGFRPRTYYIMDSTNFGL